MPRRKHRWELNSVNVTPQGAIEWVWLCKHCRSTRSQHTRPRKPAHNALTDQERAIKANTVPVSFGWPEGTPEPEGRGGRKA